MGFKDIRPREDILRPAVEFIGGPKRMGGAAALAAFPIIYWLSKRAANRNMVSNPRTRAAIVSGVMSPLLGYGAYWLTKNRIDGKLPKDGKAFGEMILGAPGSPRWGLRPEELASRTASDWSDPLNQPFGKGVLMQGVDELPATPAQKSFLNAGIKFAPGNNSTTLWGLGDGFGQAVDTLTNSSLGYMARAVEGALIGGAFGALAGLSPTHRKWAAGIGAVADSLKGSEFYRTLGEFG